MTFSNDGDGKRNMSGVGACLFRSPFVGARLPNLAAYAL
jgi:hypothetical protein